MNNYCHRCGVGLDKPPGEIQTQTVVVNSLGDGNRVEMRESYRDVRDSRIEESRETESRGEVGESGTTILNSELLEAIDCHTNEGGLGWAGHNLPCTGIIDG